MKRVPFLLVTVLIVSILCGCQVTVENCENSFNSSQTVEKKSKALRNLLKIDTKQAHLTFFTLLRYAPESDVPVFNNALMIAGTCQTIVNLTSFTETMIQPLIAEFEEIAKGKTDESQLTTQETLGLMELQSKANKILLDFNEKKFAPLEGAIKHIASKNEVCLVKALKDDFRRIGEEGEDLLSFIDKPGPLIGLMAIKEDGFAAILQAVSSQEDQIMAMMYLGNFGPYAVVPICKQMENPASTEIQRKTAGMLLLSLPSETETIDKLVETYKHGRYFPAPNMDNLENVMAAAVNGWWNYFQSIYDDKEEVIFVNYVARKHLSEPYGQDDVIRLICDVDFPTAAEHLGKLDFNTLAQKSLETLLHQVRIPMGVAAEKEKYMTERFKLFCKIFFTLTPKRREAQEFSMLLSLGDFPASYQTSFVCGCFEEKVFTEKEKEDAIFMTARLPKADRLQTYRKIRPYCTAKQQNTIDYYKKNPPEAKTKS
ncbi:hypothetical protein ACFL0Z_01475 [Patescibacteria group bacterium]